MNLEVILRHIKKDLKFFATYKMAIICAIFLGAGVAIGGAGIIGAVVGVKLTSDAEFCGSCHSMEPMVKSWEQSIHGGKNRDGVVTDCVDCHLPHDNLVNYMFAKSVTGINDVCVETFGDVSKIDWKANRKTRSHYVYDSGCMKCHKNLEESSMPNPKAFIAHKAYFLDKEGKTCVDCHKHVGHKHLGLHL